MKILNEGVVVSEPWPKLEEIQVIKCECAFGKEADNTIKKYRLIQKDFMTQGYPMRGDAAYVLRHSCAYLHKVTKELWFPYCWLYMNGMTSDTAHQDNFMEVIEAPKILIMFDHVYLLADWLIKFYLDAGQYEHAGEMERRKKIAMDNWEKLYER